MHFIGLWLLVIFNLRRSRPVMIYCSPVSEISLFVQTLWNQYLTESHLETLGVYSPCIQSLA